MNQDILAASEAGDVERVRSLLDEDPTRVNRRGDFDRTPLHWAAERDHRELAAFLIDRGAELEAETSWGHTALDWAANMGSHRVGELLLERGARGLNLVSAAGLGLTERVRAMLESDEPPQGRRPANPSPDDHWPADAAYVRGDVLGDAFFAACRNGWTEVARLLHEHGADPRSTGVFGATGLHWAAIGGHTETVDYLLSLGLDPRRRDPHFDADAAGWAAECGHQQLARALRAQAGD